MKSKQSVILGELQDANGQTITHRVFKDWLVWDILKHVWMVEAQKQWPTITQYVGTKIDIET